MYLTFKLLEYKESQKFWVNPRIIKQTPLALNQWLNPIMNINCNNKGENCQWIERREWEDVISCGCVSHQTSDDHIQSDLRSNALFRSVPFTGIDLC